MSIADIGPLSSDERIVLLVPHPDDEALSSSGLMQQAASQGATMRIVIATDGARLGRFMRSIRRKELLKSAKYSGIDSTCFEYYDFKDGNLAFEDRLTGRIQQTLDTFHPTMIITTDPMDIHPDHAAIGKCLRERVVMPASLRRIYGVLIHYPGFPRPIGRHPETMLVPPAKLSAPGTAEWVQYRLSPSEQDLKRQAIATYRSQGAHIPLAGWLLQSFDRPNELFHVLG